METTKQEYDWQSARNWEPDPETPVYIVCAANLYPSGKILVGARHCDSVMGWQYSLLDEDDKHRQRSGFIDQFGRFHNRTEAWKIAEKNGQIRRRGIGGEEADGGTLYSENLY